jgi:hypothetical protein
MQTAKRRIGLTAAGAVVPAEHPLAAMLLVGAGCELEDAEARRLGLRSVRHGKGSRWDLPRDWEAKALALATAAARPLALPVDPAVTATSAGEGEGEGAGDPDGDDLGDNEDDTE